MSQKTVIFMGKVCFVEILVCTYQYTWRYNPEKQRRHFRCLENLKSNINLARSIELWVCFLTYSKSTNLIKKKECNEQVNRKLLLKEHFGGFLKGFCRMCLEEFNCLPESSCHFYPRTFYCEVCEDELSFNSVSEEFLHNGRSIPCCLPIWSPGSYHVDLLEWMAFYILQINI